MARGPEALENSVQLHRLHRLKDGPAAKYVLATIGVDKELT